MQHLLQKDSKVFRYGNAVPVAVVWSKNWEEIWSLKKILLSNLLMETGGQEHWRWERKGWVGRGANVVDPLYPNMGIHILHTVSLYILFCADKENLLTYQVQCTLLIGNYILCSYWFSSDTVLRNWMQVTPSHVKINDRVDLDASLKQKKNQIRGNFEQLSILVVIYWYCWYSCVELQLDCWVKSYIAVPYLQTPLIAMFVLLYTYMYVIITL